MGGNEKREELDDNREDMHMYFIMYDQSCMMTYGNVHLPHCQNVSAYSCVSSFAATSIYYFVSLNV